MEIINKIKETEVKKKLKKRQVHVLVPYLYMCIWYLFEEDTAL